MEAPESSSQSHAFAEELVSCVARLIEGVCAIAASGVPAGIFGPVAAESLSTTAPNHADARAAVALLALLAGEGALLCSR